MENYTVFLLKNCNFCGCGRIVKPIFSSASEAPDQAPREPTDGTDGRT